jgi:hypothetical protein
MLSCGPGNSCCGNCAGLGAYEIDLSEQYPRTFAVLKRYVETKVANREPFYISPELNSDMIQFDGLGFINAIIAGVASVAGIVAKAAPTIATVAGMTGGGGSKSSGPTADDIASVVSPLVQQKLAAQGVNLPTEVAQQATAASLLDTFGAQNRPYVLAGAAALGVLILLKMLR